MRQSNCSAPILHGHPRVQKKNVFDKKGRGTGKLRDYSDYPITPRSKQHYFKSIEITVYLQTSKHQALCFQAQAKTSCLLYSEKHYLPQALQVEIKFIFGVNYKLQDISIYKWYEHKISCSSDPPKVNYKSTEMLITKLQKNSPNYKKNLL